MHEKKRLFFGGGEGVLKFKCAGLLFIFKDKKKSIQREK